MCLQTPLGVPSNASQCAGGSDMLMTCSIQADFWELFADEKGQSSLKNLFEEVYALLCKQRTVLVHCAAGIHRYTY